MKSMVSAILTNSLADFVVPGDEAFQAGMTKEMLSSINQSLASRLKLGYTTTFLTTLRQQGFDVYVWKLVFKDGNDDVLIFMALKDKTTRKTWFSRNPAIGIIAGNRKVIALMSRIVPVAGNKSLHNRRPSNVVCPRFIGSTSGGVRAIKGWA